METALTPRYQNGSKPNSEDEEAKLQIWKYIFGFVEMAVVKCAIELKIGDAIESHGSSITLSQLSSSLNCSAPLLQRIMRFLTHRGIFKQESPTAYAQTPLSRLLTTSAHNSMAPLLLLESSPVMLSPWLSLAACVKNSAIYPFEAAHGEDIWSFAAENPEHSNLINGGLGCFARVITVPAIMEECKEIFEGVGCLVDVGGGNGTTLSMVTKECDWIKGINYDLAHVVSVLPEYERVQHVAGDMFKSVPNADAAFLMSVLHDWNDEECIKILKKCKEAIPKEKGKVIIVDAVIDDREENKLSDVVLMMDMVMMAHTKRGKERTSEEWAILLQSAGFTRFTITHTKAVQSVIQAFP